MKNVYTEIILDKLEKKKEIAVDTLSIRRQSRIVTSLDNHTLLLAHLEVTVHQNFETFFTLIKRYVKPSTHQPVPETMFSIQGKQQCRALYLFLSKFILLISANCFYSVRIYFGSQFCNCSTFLNAISLVSSADLSSIPICLTKTWNKTTKDDN